MSSGAPLGRVPRAVADRKLKVLVVDDHDVVHWGFRVLLGEQSWVERCLAAKTGAVEHMPEFAYRMRWFIENKPQYAERVSRRNVMPGIEGYLLSIVGPSRLERILAGTPKTVLAAAMARAAEQCRFATGTAVEFRMQLSKMGLARLGSPPRRLDCVLCCSGAGVKAMVSRLRPTLSSAWSVCNLGADTDPLA